VLTSTGPLEFVPHDANPRVESEFLDQRCFGQLPIPHPLVEEKAHVGLVARNGAFLENKPQWVVENTCRWEAAVVVNTEPDTHVAVVVAAAMDHVALDVEVNNEVMAVDRAVMAVVDRVGGEDHAAYFVPVLDIGDSTMVVVAAAVHTAAAADDMGTTRGTGAYYNLDAATAAVAVAAADIRQHRLDDLDSFEDDASVVVGQAEEAYYRHEAAAVVEQEVVVVGSGLQSAVAAAQTMQTSGGCCGKNATLVVPEDPRGLLVLLMRMLILLMLMMLRRHEPLLPWWHPQLPKECLNRHCPLDDVDDGDGVPRVPSCPPNPCVDEP
jgi:hypothetical protein